MEEERPAQRQGKTGAQLDVLESARGLMAGETGGGGGQVSRVQQPTARTSAFTLGTMEPPQGFKRRRDRTTFPAKGPRLLVDSGL